MSCPLLRHLILVCCTCAVLPARAQQRVPDRSVIIQDLNQRVKDGKPLLVHAIVALADNQHQGIVPVPARLGDGDDPDNNLYWGALYGARTHFKKSGWKPVITQKNPDENVLERIVFRKRFGKRTVYLLADGYRGSRIQQATQAFLEMTAGTRTIELEVEGQALSFHQQKVLQGTSQVRRRLPAALDHRLAGLRLGMKRGRLATTPWRSTRESLLPHMPTG